MTNISGASQLNVSAYLPHNERYTQAHVRDGTILRNQLEELGKLVLDPKSVVVVEEGNVLYGFSAKVQRYIGMLKGRVLSREPEVKALVKLMSETGDPEVGERAWQVLNALKKLDPTLEGVNFSNKGHWKGFLNFNYLLLRTKIKPAVGGEQKGVDHPFWHLKEIVVGAKSGWYFYNLEDVAVREGFQVTKAESPLKFEWLRDPVLILGNGKIVVPSRMHVDDIGVIDSFYGKTDMMMLKVAESGASQQLLHYKEVKEAPFYFEGGNLLPALNLKGEAVYLSGATNIFFSAMNAHFLIRSEEAKKQLQKEMESLTLSVPQLEMVQVKLERAGLLKGVAKESKEKCAKIFVASMYYFGKQVANTLGTKITTLGDLFEPLPEYHLDLFLLPAPGGIVFLHDYDFSREVLLAISKNHKLTQEEQERMSLYMTYVIKKQRSYGSLLNEIRKQLEKSHFKVVPMTGFFDESMEKVGVCFSNAIMGTNEEGAFCITNGSSHPFDRYLREAFADHLHKNGISRVYFTGKETPLNNVWRGPTPANAYVEADRSIRAFGGIHCRTQVVTSQKPFPALTPGVTPAPFNEESVQVTLPKFFQKMLN